MSESIRLLENALNITLFGRLVLEPDLLEMLLGILTLEQVAEDKLILVDGLFRHDQGQGPTHLVIEGEGLMDFQSARGLWRHPVEIILLLWCCASVSTEGSRA